MPAPRTRQAASRLAAAGLGVILAFGCTQRLTLRTAPIPEGSVPPLIIDAPVSVEAAPVDRAGRAYDVGWYELEIDYREFTEAAVHDLAEELRRQEIVVTPGGTRRIELSVMHVDLAHKFGAFDCIIDYRVRTGDGTVSGLQARASGANPRAACSAAVPNVAGATLTDPAIIAYLIGAPTAPRPGATTRVAPTFLNVVEAVNAFTLRGIQD